jgi:hypothetical protein
MLTFEPSKKVNTGNSILTLEGLTSEVSMDNGANHWRQKAERRGTMSGAF